MFLKFVINVRFQHCGECKKDEDCGYRQQGSANAMSYQGKAIMHILNGKSYNFFFIGNRVSSQKYTQPPISSFYSSQPLCPLSPRTIPSVLFRKE